jgi:hypothetical protein
MRSSKAAIRGDLSMAWMHCANEECGELIVRADEHGVEDAAGAPIIEARSWLARPQWSSSGRRVDSLVPEPFRTDYQEAAAILDVSARMSAVMSRRVLADLLEKYAGLTQFSLEARIDAFIADTANPVAVRENLHHFREGANFGAHTQKDDQAEVIDVGRDDAEWMLDLLDRLFEHFIVTPERDKAMRKKMDERIKAVGRKEIKPLSTGDGGS